MLLPTKYSKLGRNKSIVRDQYIKIQQGLCYYCQGSLKAEPPKHITDKPINWSLFPKGFLNYPIHLQHNHETDMTEGAVHAYCNAVMWEYEGR